MPDADLFRAISAGTASVVTDRIERFTPKGVLLGSGDELPADVVVAATGLEMLAFGGASFEVDGEPVDLAGAVAYKGMMFSGLPNLALALGYTNASWTLKCDLISQYVCRLLTYLDDTATARSRRDVRRRTSRCCPSSTCSPATSSVPRPCSRSRAAATRGASTRTTSATASSSRSPP